MDPGELNSKSPGRNLFDPGSLGHPLFGASPTAAAAAASLYAHYAHLPNSLSLLGHPSAFPSQFSLSSSPYGGLGSLAVTSASSFTTPSGAAWWPAVASRLLAPDYLMRSLAAASTTSTTFGSISRDSGLPGFDALNQQAHHPSHKTDHKSPARKRLHLSSSHTSSSSPPPVRSSPSRSPASSSRNLSSALSSPIYTNPSTGVTITPITYDKSSDNRVKQNGSVLSSSPSSSPSSSKSQRLNLDRHPTTSSGVHILPVTVVSKNSASYPVTVTKLSKSHGSSRHGKSDTISTEATDLKIKRDSFSSVSSRSSNRTDLDGVYSGSCSASSCDETEEIARHRRKRDRRRIDGLLRQTGHKSVEAAALMASSIGTKEAVSILPTSSNDAPSLDLSDSAPSPLNLSLKQNRGSSASPQPPVLIPAAVPHKKKTGPKPKSIPSPLEAAELFEKQLQNDFRAHLENQLKHQMHLEAAVRRLNAHHHAKEGHHSRDRHSQSSSPQLHLQGNKLKSPPTPHVVITAATPISQPKPSSQSAPNIVTITAIPSSNKAISLLTGAPAIMNAIPDSAALTSSSKNSLLAQSKTHSPFGSTSSLDGVPHKKHHLLTTPTKKELRAESRDSTPGDGSADEAARKIVAKFRTLEEDTSDDESSEEESSDESAESSSKSESSSSESESESESQDTEDTEQSQTTSTGSTPVPSSHLGLKRSRHHDYSGTASPTKRRRITVDEKELRIPIEHGWRRQTKIRTFSYSGVRGVVTYFAPCGKKLKTYPEVIRYLDKNKITDITRENFSFSTKVNIGEFLESLDGSSEFVPLGELEVLARIAEVRATRGRRSGRRTGEGRHRVKEGSRMRHKLEQQAEVARRAHEMKMRRKLDRERAVMEAKEAKKMRVIEARKMKEHERLLRQQEKYERQEQLRVEKEQRAQQMIEARKKRQEELERQRVEEAVKKNQEREMKRQQAVFMKEQEQQKRREMLLMVDLERERRRQHMLLVKALEAHKKQEEKERIREERKVEKLLNRERKMEQRKLELQALRELKKPIEDMEITDAQPLPTLNRIPGVKLPGQAFADILMVLEFLHNFGETLGFDMHHLPTLNTLQMAMLNNEDAEEELMSTLHHLLTCAIEDPGTLVNTKRLSVLGHALKEVDITGYTMSEVLRIYVVSQTGEDSDMSKWLKERPYLSLNATQKASILAFVCNELLCSRGICRQIDNSIETVHNLRREKWMVEGNLRKLRTIHFKKLGRSLNKLESNPEGDKEKGDKSAKPTSPSKAAKDEEDEDGGNESGNESDGSNGTGQGEVEVDDPEDEEMGMSSEDLKKQIDKLSKQLNQFRNKLLKSSQQLRAMSFGQDRYKRRFWVLPYAGGMFVEGLESAEAQEDMFSCTVAPVLDGMKEVENGEPPHLEDMKNVKCEAGERVDAPVSTRVEASTPELDKNKCLDTSNKRTTDTDTKCAVKEEIKTESSKQTETNLFLRKPEELGNLSECIKNSDSNSPSPSLTPSSEKTTLNHTHFPGISNSLVFPPPLGSPCSKELNGTAYMNFLKCDTSAQQNGGFPNVLGFPQYPFSAEQMLKTMGEKMGLKPWFSVLPRMPCDETSLTRLHNKSPSKNSSNSAASSKFSPLPYSAFSMYSSTPSFATLQMGVINGTPSSFAFGHAPPSPHLVLPSPIHRSPTPNRSGVSFSNVSSMATSSVNATPSQNNEVVESGPNGTGDGLPVLEKSTPSAEVKPIPIELQRGWWRITDANQLKTLMALLHQRGLRERILFKQLERYEDFACQSCGKGNNDAIDLEITDLDRKVSQLPGGAPEEDGPDTWFPEVALRVDLALLEHIENIEDRVINSSMQSKSWKPLPKVSTDDSIKFRPVCAPTPEPEASPTTHSPLEFCRERLLALQTYIEPRYIKPPLGTSTSELNFSNLSNGNNVSNVTKDNSNEGDKEEDKGDSKDKDKEGADPDDSGNAAEDEAEAASNDTPPGLTHWRECVQKVNTSAQLAMCLTALENCIAWDKSIMKASCQFCNSGDNEAMLLLCDGCDKGYHTYCFKPKMENIPEGDWFCNECINKATGDTMCMVCSKKGKNLCICDTCPKAYHIDCLDPPLSRPPKGKWHCPRCHQRPNKSKSRSHKKKEVKKDDESTESSSKPEKPTSAKGSAKDRNTKDKKANLDFAPCRAILDEMEKHEDAWPFLLPVNTKQFPSYRKVIKKPMDLSTMRNKLVDGSYKSRDEFANDARCICDNCETFNEDDSPVGKAGHNLRAFFEMKWSEATGN